MINKCFSDIVAENFDEIYKNFRAGLKSKGYTFSEDIMNDAFISCVTTLKDKQMSKQEALKYYWTAYINRFKTLTNREHRIEYVEDITEYEDIPSQVYNDAPDKIYDIVIKELQDHYGIKKVYLWELYALRGKTTNEIKSMGFKDINNYACFTKQVKRYIKNHIIKNNQLLQELIKNRKDN